MSAPKAIMIAVVRAQAPVCALLAVLVAAADVGVAAAEEAALGQGYWSFQPLQNAAAPIDLSGWSANPVDSFIRRGLAANGLEPSRPVDRHRLLRRVCLDLTGLPPSPEQARAFLEDRSPWAYDRLVDSLLASPHYGERWAQKWLDVVRFADTDGFERDGYREHGWRFRDYVVHSFNTDKPFDRFVREQVAGDELYPGDREALIATGFNGAGPRHIVGGNQDKDEARQEVLTEMALGVGQALLGLTVQCARCHDHKFDPISQREYYQLESFFAATELKDVLVSSADEVAAHERLLKEHEARLEPIKEALKAIEEPFQERVRARKRSRLNPEHRAALEVPDESRSELQKRLAKEATALIKPVWYEIVPLMPDDVKSRRTGLRQRMHALELDKPDPPAAAYGVAGLEKTPETHVLRGGDYRRKAEPVAPGFLRVIGPLGVELPADGPGRRAALARWLTDPANPLTARVIANRIWEFRMGRGLVADPNNLGLLGGQPSHPGLLDYLATRLLAEGWSIKTIDRLILLSGAYRQSSAIDAERDAADPENLWYWRANRRRLEGEVIRDSALAASDRLNRSVAGKPVRIPIEREVYDLIFTEAEPDNLWPVTPERSQHDRRSLYLLNMRTVRLPFLANFDQPDTMTSCAVRTTSTHALQSLSLLNSDFIVDQSQALAERIRTSCAREGRRCQVERAFEFTLARPPTSEEAALARKFLKSGPTALDDFSLALLNRNEFVYRP